MGRIATGLIAACLLTVAGRAADVTPAVQRGHDQTARPQLTEADGGPIDLSVVYTFDVWRNASGGRRRGWRYLDNLDVILAVDAERAFGWNGTTIFIYGLYNNGSSLTDELVGDLQTVSNIDAGAQAARLYEAWVEQRFASDRASVKVGLYDLNSEFDTNNSNALFINSSHGIGPDLSQTGRNGPSIFPVTALAVRADYRLGDAWLVRAAVLDGVPGNPDRPKRTAIRLGDGDGALLVSEVEYRDSSMKAAAGYWRYTARFDDLATGRARRGNDGVYVMVERRLMREGDSDQGLSGWLRLGFADSGHNVITRFYGAGLVRTGAILNRDEDQFGIAVAWAEISAPYRRVMRNAGTPAVRNEVNIEITYRAALTPWLIVQPDLQYTINPGADPARRNAKSLGVRFEFGF